MAFTTRSELGSVRVRRRHSCSGSREKDSLLPKAAKSYERFRLGFCKSSCGQTPLKRPGLQLFQDLPVAPVA